MTNTTPLNEEDRLGEILTAVFNEGMAYQVSSLKDYKDLNFMSVKTAKQELTNLIQTLEKKAYENGLHDGEQVATFVFIKRLQARKKNTAPNSGAGREIKDLLKELEK